MSENCNIENSSLALNVDPYGMVTVFDKRSHALWGQEGGEGRRTCGLMNVNHPTSGGAVKLSDSYSIGVRVSDVKNVVLLKFRGLVVEGRGLVDGKVAARISLQDDAVVFEVLEVVLPEGWWFESITFPYGFGVLGSDETGYIVVPHVAGQIYPTDYFSEAWPHMEDTFLKNEAGDGKDTHLKYRRTIPYIREQLWRSVTDLTDEEWAKLPWGSTEPFTLETAAPSPGSKRTLLKMPWFGAVKKGSGYMALVHTHEDCVYEVHLADPARSRCFFTEPVWLASRGVFSYPRKIEYRFIPHADYVVMAKEYRKYAMQDGTFVSLAEKAESVPNVGKLVGAPIVRFWCFDRWRRYGLSKVSTTYQQMTESIKDMKKNLGLEKAIILATAVNRGGFDNQYPDIWPPASEAGTLGQLKDSCLAADSSGYLFGIYDNYFITFDNASSVDLDRDTMKLGAWNQDGYPIAPSGTWQGGQAFELCSTVALRYLKRNMEMITADLEKVTASFLDILTAVGPRECWDERHPLSRAKELEARMDQVKYLVDELGLIMGSEGGDSFAVPKVHYMEGVMDEFPWDGIRVPLFNLVFHDAVVSYWWIGGSYAQAFPLSKNHMMLYDLLNGNPGNWTFNARTYKEQRRQLADIAQKTSAFSSKVGFEEMTQHEFLSDDYAVQRSRFANGAEVAVNLGRHAFKLDDGHSLVPGGYRLSET